MIPAAKHLTITNRFRSGCRAGIERVTSGKHTPIMLVTRIEKMAMIFRGRALDLLMQPPDSVPQSSDSERVWSGKRAMKMKRVEMSLRSDVEAMESYFWLL